MFKELLYNLNIIKKKHHFQPFVYITESGYPTNRDTNRIMWLDDIQTITCRKNELHDKVVKLKQKYVTNKIYFSAIHLY